MSLYTLHHIYLLLNLVNKTVMLPLIDSLTLVHELMSDNNNISIIVDTF